MARKIKVDPNAVAVPLSGLYPGVGTAVFYETGAVKYNYSSREWCIQTTYEDDSGRSFLIWQRISPAMYNEIYYLKCGARPFSGIRKEKLVRPNLAVYSVIYNKLSGKIITICPDYEVENYLPTEEWRKEQELKEQLKHEAAAAKLAEKEAGRRILLDNPVYGRFLTYNK